MTREQLRAAVEAAVRRYEDYMGKTDPLPALLDEIDRAAVQFADAEVARSRRGIQIGNHNTQINTW